jgi:hypothetical protein
MRRQVAPFSAITWRSRRRASSAANSRRFRSSTRRATAAASGSRSNAAVASARSPSTGCPAAKTWPAVASYSASVAVTIVKQPQAQTQA